MHKHSKQVFGILVLLLCSSVGFAQKTADTSSVTIDTLRKPSTQKTLKGVRISKRRKSTEISSLSVQNMQKIGTKELAKAACCNLSESFETTPSVDVGYTDAISGYKQISMLGLSGPNVAFTRENVPDMRGLSSIIGLTFTPGTWVESIQLSKGAGSVVNGHEGVAGQINVELTKPSDDGYKWLFNGYQSTQGRSEGNIVWNKRVNKHITNSAFVHAKGNWLKVDQNSDAFLDQPLGKTLLLSDRWMYLSDNGLEFQLGFRYSYMDLWGGEKSFSKEQEIINSNPWGFVSSVNRGDLWGKIGKVYKNKPYKSMGLQISTAFHDQAATYGIRNYDARQHSFYANYIYQSIINNTNHVIKLGASFAYDKFDETFSATKYKRTEQVPGAFAEYTFKPNEQFTLVAGIRGDVNNLYGAFVTPRLHLRYAIDDKNTLRASIGRAQRTVNVFAENIGYMASNRSFEIATANVNDKAYGLSPEVSWNMGVNYLKKFMLNYRDGSFSADYYYTHFNNLVTVDIENYDKVRFYNATKPAFAHSFQAQLDYEPIRRLDVRLAYRWYNIRQFYNDAGWKERPLIAAQRAFINLTYESKNGWLADLTANWIGSKRLPQHVEHNGTHIASEMNTKSYALFNAQISKSWGKMHKYRMYLGVENILGEMQHDLVLNRNQPFGTGFDASLVWGNPMGRNVYAGFNVNLK